MMMDMILFGIVAFYALATWALMKVCNIPDEQKRGAKS